MKFMHDEVPKEKKFLFNYFNSKIQVCFLRYVLFFGDYENFRDHTGYMCQDRWLKELFSKYNDLIFIYNLFKKNMDLDNLGRLNSGKFKICNRKNIRYTI